MKGSPENLKAILASDEMQSIMEIIQGEAEDQNSIAPVEIGSEGWELEIAKRSGMARGLLRALDIMKENTEDDG